jgi:hypothetical protein
MKRNVLYNSPKFYCVLKYCFWTLICENIVLLCTCNVHVWFTLAGCPLNECVLAGGVAVRAEHGDRSAAGREEARGEEQGVRRPAHSAPRPPRHARLLLAQPRAEGRHVLRHVAHGQHARTVSTGSGGRGEGMWKCEERATSIDLEYSFVEVSASTYI